MIFPEVFACAAMFPTSTSCVLREAYNKHDIDLSRRRGKVA